MLTSAILLLCLASLARSLKFELAATLETDNVPFCLSEFIGNEVLISGHVEVGNGYNQKVNLEIHDLGNPGNKYFVKKDVKGNVKFTFTTHDSADVFFCFTNALDNGISPYLVTKDQSINWAGLTPGKELKRTINFHLDTGSEAVDFADIAIKEKLKPSDLDLKRAQAILDEMANDLEHLKTREMELRDINGQPCRIDHYVD